MSIGRLPDEIVQLAPGTPLRDGLDRIVSGHTGALVVLGTNPALAAIQGTRQRINDSLDRLTTLAGRKRVAILCGEPIPWRCHRSLIATTLTARGWRVWHLMTGAEPRLHELGAWGATPHVDAAGVVTYPA